MACVNSLDLKVRRSLSRWPQRPPGVRPRYAGRDAWLRGRPTENETTLPFLKVPGSTQFRTIPDGLWLNFGGTTAEPFVDILVIEACGSRSNLLDKRSRFAPSMGSMMAVCPRIWLLAPANPTEPHCPRWRATGILDRSPSRDLVLPVRDVRVLYALKRRDFEGFANSQVPHPHEFFAPMEALTGDEGHTDPALQALLSNAYASANFMPVGWVAQHA